MYTKKKQKKIGTVLERESRDYAPRISLDRDLLSTLINIQEKLNSPVFNGGFDSLVSSVEDIKNSQRKVEESLGEINKTIYEPDEGLFSRIKTAEKKQDSDVKDLSTKVSSVETAVNTKVENVETALATRIKSLEDSKAFWQRGLWLAIPAGVGLIVKAAYDFIISHVSIK